jgi:protein-L-isoaspartate(D-aspartate) O-methyltransferase
MAGNEQVRLHRTKMVDDLVAAGELTDECWRQAFLSVPRHWLVPDYYQGGSYVRGLHDIDSWLRVVYSDVTLVTQREQGMPTSSGTMPSLIATMLHALDVADGDRVLQVATGTGYTAGLLCERVGCENVTSIDIDAALTSTARDRLRTCGYTPTIVTGDGTLGYPAHAPYDRIVVTFEVTRVPSAWIDQTRVGGVVVAPVCSGLAKLTVTGHGEAHGRFVGPGYFIRHRDATPPPAVSKATAPQWPDRVTELPSSAYFDTDFRFFLDLAKPGLVFGYRGDPNDLTIIAPDGSHAHVTPDGQLTQTGQHRVWDDIEAIHQKWHSLDGPPRERFGLTVTPTRQHIWLDDPSSEHRWPLHDH